MVASGEERESGGSVRRHGRELRTRYEPKVRIRLAYLNAAPWLDLLFLLFFLILVQSRIVLRPGVVVALPTYSGQAGVQGGDVAVMTYTGRGRQLSCTVFYADEPFLLDNPGRVEALAQVLARHAYGRSSPTLTVYADQSVPHHYVMLLMEMAGEAGFSQLNLGTSPVRGALP